MKTHALAPYLQRFFTERLGTQLKASPNTIISYRDTFRLLLRYVAEQLKKAPTTLEIAETPDVEHPLVRTHPDNGRKALYLNFNRLDRIGGMERGESDALLDDLAAHCRRPEFHYAHQWSVGDAVSDVEHEFVIENQNLRDEAGRLRRLAARSVQAAIVAQDLATGTHEAWLDDALRSVVTRDPSP